MGNYLEARKRANTAFGRLSSGIEKERIWQRDKFTIGSVLPASARKEASSPAPAEDCLPILIDWPFSADENGIPFDQANLYGMAYRAPTHDDDYKDFIPIPKTLPSGYTLLHPRSGVSGYEDPAQLFEQVRTATGVFNRYTLPGYRYYCKPRAQMRKPAPGGGPGSPSYDFAGSANVLAGPYTGGQAYAYFAGFNGIRGCSYVAYLESVRNNPFPAPPDPGGWVRVSFLLGTTSAQWNFSTNANPPTLLFSVEGTSKTTAVSGTSLASLLPDAGIVATLYVVTQSQYTDADDAYYDDISFVFSESTQVPWCHSIAYGNKVAAGGLVNPYA